MCRYSWGSGSGWGWGSLTMAVLMVVLVVAVIVAIVFAVRYVGGGRTLHQRAGGDDMGAENTLAERFARGEIDEDDFRGRMTLVRERRSPR